MALKKSLKNLSYLVSANVIIKVLGLISLMIFTRVLLKEELAVVPAFALLGRLSMVMFSFGVLPCLVRDVPSLYKNQEMDTVRAFIRTCLLLVVPGVALFSFLCYILSAEIAIYIFDSQKFDYYLKLLSVGIFFNGVSQLFSYIYWGLSKFKHESERMVVVGVVKIVSGIVLVLWMGVEGLILSLVLSYFVNFVIYAYNLRDIIFIKARLYPIKKLLRTSWPFYIESYLMYIRGEGDQLIVTTLLGAEALAIYFVAKRPFELLRSFTTSLDKITTTTLAELKDDLTLFSAKVNNMISLNLYVLLPVFFFVMGLTPTLMVIIAGHGYDQSIIPAILLILTLFCQYFWTSTFGRAIFILSSSVNRFKMTLIESALLLILILILGKFYLMIGIVTGRLLATILTGIVAFFLVRHKVIFTLKVKQVLAISISSSVMFVILIMVQYITDNYIMIVSSGIFAGLVFLFIVNITISEHFYKCLNTVSPIKIKDPINMFISRLF